MSAFPTEEMDEVIPVIDKFAFVIALKIDTILLFSFSNPKLSLISTQNHVALGYLTTDRLLDNFFESVTSTVAIKFPSDFPILTNNSYPGSV